MRKLRSFTDPFFLVALFLLLFNDLFLKEFFHNSLTGKLSDFTGLFVFGVFWRELLPKWEKTLLLGIGLIFLIWKSPLSQGAIEAWNALPFFNVGRTVDGSDLLALSVLPFVYLHARYKRPLGNSPYSPVLPLLLACFAFMATSYRSEVEHRADYRFTFPKDTLLKRLNGNSERVRAIDLWEERQGDTARTVYVHRFEDDSLSIHRYRDMQEDLGDTVVITIRDSLLTRFRAEVAILAEGDSARMELYRFLFDRPNKERYQERLPKVFERKVVRPLNGRSVE